jgi:pilus assembly protein Flp/PilA
MTKLMRRLIWEDEGQDLIEYALLAAFIALAATAAMILLGSGISGFFNSVNNQLASAAGS